MPQSNTNIIAAAINAAAVNEPFYENGEQKTLRKELGRRALGLDALFNPLSAPHGQYIDVHDGIWTKHDDGSWTLNGETLANLGEGHALSNSWKYVRAGNLFALALAIIGPYVHLPEREGVPAWVMREAYRDFPVMPGTRHVRGEDPVEVADLNAEARETFITTWQRANASWSATQGDGED